MDRRFHGWLFLLALTGCTSVSSNYTGAITQASDQHIIVCHGFNCRHQTTLALGKADATRFASIMDQGKGSPSAERAAVGQAVRYFEERSAQSIGVRDQPKSTLSQSGHAGQMDCIDESTNTRSLLRYLDHRGLLRHHAVEWNVTRGMLIDGRYPHSTAVLREPSGKRWAVDSWYGASGDTPDIMPLEEWLKRGVLGER